MNKFRTAVVAFACTCLSGLAHADQTVTLPFELTAGFFNFDTAVSNETLDPASEYDFTFDIESVTVMGDFFGEVIPFDAMTEFTFLTPLLTSDAGTVSAPLPAAAHEAHYIMIDPATQSTVGDFSVYYDIEADGSLATALEVGPLGTFQFFGIAQSVTVTGTATASVVPAPGAVALAASGMFCLAGRRRRN